jgi:NADH-quinone oxidoreductase subunit H
VRRLKTDGMLDQDLLVWGAVAAGVVFLLTFLVPERKKPQSDMPDEAAMAGYPVPKQWEEN